MVTCEDWKSSGKKKIQKNIFREFVGNISPFITKKFFGFESPGDNSIFEPLYIRI